MSLTSRGRLSILIFHRVLAVPDPMLPGEPCADEFDALLGHLKRRYEVISLAKAVQQLQMGGLPPRAIAITFDDGYADNLSIAAPLIRKHGLTATVFVVSANLDSNCMWNDRVIEAFRSTTKTELDLAAIGLGKHRLLTLSERRMAVEAVLPELKYLPLAERQARSLDVQKAADVPDPAPMMIPRGELHRLAEYGVDVGAHTFHHPILARMADSEAWNEIADNKRDLEEVLARPITLFAYPNGKPNRDFTSEHVRMVREAGFAAAVTTAFGTSSASSELLELPRFTPWSRRPLYFDLLMLRNMRESANLRAA
jgi:peptidoglycan/xylan/chitin deacetylase (PgdA/CDA1 family)